MFDADVSVTDEWVESNMPSDADIRMLPPSNTTSGLLAHARCDITPVRL
ncbi:MAG: hypothetical protein R2715_24510 [Ilumatobacteraceae bacterium]